VAVLSYCVDLQLKPSVVNPRRLAAKRPLLECAPVQVPGDERNQARYATVTGKDADTIGNGFLIDNLTLTSS
jgi:hypothetical protein